MPHTLAREKALLQSLVAIGKLTLHDAIIYFSKGDKVDIRAAEIGLRRLIGHDLIEVRNDVSDRKASPRVSVLEKPDGYVVVFLGYAGGERLMSETHSGMLGANPVEIDDATYLVVIEPQRQTTVDGSLEGVTILYERVRAFTHRFALHIVHRHYPLAVDLFAQVSRSPDAVEVLRSSIEKREKSDGTYDMFDHVVVDGLYHQYRGKKSSLKSSDIWKDIADNGTRRGVSTFELGSIVTPAGVILDGCLMSLSVVEEEGLLRVHRYKLYSGN